MKKFLFSTLALTAVALFATSCSCYKSMMKKAQDNVTVSCAPEVLTLKGDNVVGQITVNFAPKTFHKWGVLKVTPVLVSATNGERVAGEPTFLQGENVTDNYATIAYKAGGSYSQNVSIPYNKNLRLSQLVLAVEAKCLKQGNKVKNFTQYPTDIAVALGTSTVQLLADNYAKVAYAPDAFKRITYTAQEANILFTIANSNVRSSQLKSDELEALEQFIIANTGNPKRTVGAMQGQAYASPDGPLTFNDKLSQNRANTTEKALLKKYKKDGVLKNNVYDVNALGEDWEGFKDIVKKSDIEDKNLILQVLSMYSDPVVREKEIKNMTAAFEVLAEKVLPELRRSKLRVNVEVQGLTDDEMKAAVASDVNSLGVEEMLFAAANLYTDLATKEKIYTAAANKYNCYRAWNNLGVVNVKNGDYAAAKANFNKAAALNGADAYVVNNLGVVALAEGKKADAAKYFAASSIAQAKYNNGLVELANGNYDTAVNYLDGFNKALANYLIGNISAAKECTCKSWRNSYLKAIIAANEGNTNEFIENLTAAINANPQVKELAASEVNFVKFFEHADFVAIVEVVEFEVI